MKNILSTLILALLFSISVMGQDYRQAAGIRLGASSGLTYRRFIGSDLAAELMLNGQNNGTVLTLLVEKRRPALVFDHLNLDFMYGAGVHLGMANHKNRDFSNDDPFDYHDNNSIVPQLGFDGYISFEYLFEKYPLIVNMDCKPYLEIFDDRLFGLHMPVIAFGAKYIF